MKTVVKFLCFCCLPRTKTLTNTPPSPNPNQVTSTVDNTDQEEEDEGTELSTIRRVDASSDIFSSSHFLSMRNDNEQQIESAGCEKIKESEQLKQTQIVPPPTTPTRSPRRKKAKRSNLKKMGKMIERQLEEEGVSSVNVVSAGTEDVSQVSQSVKRTSRSKLNMTVRRLLQRQKEARKANKAKKNQRKVEENSKEESSVSQVQSVSKDHRNQFFQEKLLGDVYEYEDVTIAAVPSQPSNERDSLMTEVYMEKELLNIIIADNLINYDDLIFIRKIGQGAFAEVFEADWIMPHNGTTQKVAVKRLKAAPARLTQLRAFAREISCLKRVSHLRNVVKFKGACLSPFCCVVMEYVEGGSLEDYLADLGQPLDLVDALKCAKDIAEGIKQLHHLKPPIIHRDIHSQNVLVKLGPLGKAQKVVIGDFGIARTKEEKGIQQLTPTGHPRYRAPEITKKLPYSKKVDIYCFGSCLYELVTGTKMYGNLTDKEVTKLRMDGQMPKVPDTVPKSLRKLIVRCWATNPKASTHYSRSESYSR